MGKIIEILRKCGDILFPPALFREWPFMLIFCMMSAPFPCYFLLRAIYLPAVWLPALRDVLIVLFFAWICARIIVLFKRRWIRNAIKTLLYVLLLIQFLIFFVSFRYFNFGICPDLFVILLQTNAHEAKGFISTFLLPALPTLLAIIFLFSILVTVLECTDVRIRLIIHRLRHGSSLIRTGRVICICCIIAGAVFSYPILKLLTLDYSEIRKGWGNAALFFKGADSLVDNTLASCIYSIAFIYKGNKEYDKWEHSQCSIGGSVGSEKLREDSLSLVFVLGESYIRSHSQLYGYNLPTAPSQSREMGQGNLITFTDISTIAKITDVVISNSINLNNISQDELWQSSVFFPLIMKKAGWNVYYSDNNTTGKGLHNFMAHNIFSSDVIRKECFSQSIVSDSARFDHEMVAESFATSYEKAANNFYIYHLNGQHVPFKGAVPEGWERFGVEDYRYRKEPWMDDERRQMIADYDNATLANDSVMGMIYNHFRGKNAVVVYVSDHGEEVYDYRDSMGRKNRTDNTMEQYIESFFMVPATVWMSPKFRELYPGKVDAIKKAASRRGSIDDIGHFILGLAEVSSPYYRPERDIASESYKPVRRLTTEGFYIDPE